jgi:hypothetical protein
VLPHFLDSWLTGGGEVFSHPLPQEDSWYSFLLEAELTLGHIAAGKIRSIEKCSDFIRNQTPNLPALQPTTLLCAQGSGEESYSKERSVVVTY